MYFSPLAAYNVFLSTQLFNFGYSAGMFLVRELVRRKHVALLFNFFSSYMLIYLNY